MADIAIERVYDADPPGVAFLVDGLWPRGVRKDDLDARWLRVVAPSRDLRSWFGHDVDRWEEFQRRYRAELDANRSAAEPLIDAAATGPITLLFAAKDRDHNNAVVLRDWLLNQPELQRRNP